MRVHFKNVIASAIEAGVVTGYNDALNKKLTDPNAVVDMILQNVWNSLDDIVDFSEDDEQETRRPMGFGPSEPVYTDAISNDTIADDESDDDMEETDTLRRATRRSPSRQTKRKR